MGGTVKTLKDSSARMQQLGRREQIPEAATAAGSLKPDTRSWSFLKDFKWVAPPPMAPTWSDALRLIEAARKRQAHDLAQLRDWLNNEDAQFRNLGGDPLHEDWAAFWPLRLSREEDWSNWLAHLIATSSTRRLLVGDSARQAPELHLRPPSRPPRVAATEPVPRGPWHRASRRHLDPPGGEDRGQRLEKDYRHG